MVNNLYTLTLLKAFDILDCFETDTQEISIKEIAQRIGMPQSSVCRILQSLEFEGMIFQNNENKKYRLGAKLLAYSSKSGLLSEYLHLASKHVQRLGELTGETVNLAVSSCDKILNIYKVDSKHILRPNFTLNTPYPAYCTGTGQVLLSQTSDASLRWVYDNNKERIGVPFERFLETIHAVRDQGYAYDDQAFSSGLRCVAAPVAGPGSKAIFALSISAPVARVDDETYRRYQNLVVKYAGLISEELLSAL